LLVNIVPAHAAYSCLLGDVRTLPSLFLAGPCCRGSALRYRPRPTAPRQRGSRKGPPRAWTPVAMRL